MGKKPLQSPITAWGSKFKAITQIRLQEFIPPCTGNNIYVEMFCFSASMFFNLSPRPTQAILNDKNAALINFWQVVRHQRASLEEELQFVFHSQQDIDEFQTRDDPVGRAIFFYLCNKYSFSGASTSEHFNYVFNSHPIHKDFTKWAEMLDKSNTLLWDLDFRDAFSKLGGKGNNIDHFTIYCDPPYLDNQNSKVEFVWQDHVDLAQCCHDFIESTPKNTIILSYSDNNQIRELYKKWNIIECSWQHSIKNKNRANGREMIEILISNRPLVRRTNN